AFIGDSVGLDRALDRSLAIPGMPPDVRAKAIDGVISTLLTGSHPTPEGLARAEGLATALDTLAGAPDATRLAARQSLVGYYDYADVDAPLRRNAEAMLTVARRMGNAAAVGRSYEALARVAGDYLHADSAIMVLDHGQRELTALGAADLATRSFEPLRSLYALVGTPGFPIHGAYWLNAPDTMRTLPVGGRVLLIQFTAHWCVPCRNSYPGIRHLAARFAGDAFETVFSTDLYGYFGSTSNKLSAEQELAADRAYYVKDHEIPFKVAINDRRTAPLPTKPGTAPSARPPETDADRYHVEGIPQMFVLDKRGVIRATVTGWDPGSEARLGALIEQLLREP
ncbi:MAG TPA: TlpA disulfide reductase family protein, partial [Gemmatimonadaceae bacterium]|nr:TlpA disulfide reductase family protein [Gemmatimonadaceae bacterium]